MGWLYATAQPFVWHPGRALLVAVGWLLLGLVVRPGRRAFLVAAAAWSIFAGLELMAWRQRADIRVDLLVTWPALCVLSLVCAGVGLRRLVVRTAGMPPEPPAP
jgi:hypothetical protein